MTAVTMKAMTRPASRGSNVGDSWVEDTGGKTQDPSQVDK